MDWSSKEIDKIVPAFLAAQKASKSATKDKKNPHLKNMYSDFASVVDACKESLHDNGIAYIQLLGNKDGKNTIKTILMHESTQWIGDEAFLPEIDQKGINAAQATGSAISYMKRYGLQSATGVISEDDDGNAAGQSSGQKASEQAKPQASGEPTKDVAQWKAEADKNTAHIKNLKNWYAKHKPEILKLTKVQQDEINKHVKVLSEKLEKDLADKKAAEQVKDDADKDLQRGDGSESPPPTEHSDVEPF